jgi:GH35 family endo-1,4-beta-xylanase
MGISQDAYHLDLVQYLNENYEVENPEFSIADTEQGVISSMSIYGNSSSSVTDASNLGFSKISTLNVPNALNNQWDTGYNTRNKVAVEEGDIVVLAFWAKRNSPSSELFFFAEDANNFDKEFYFSFGLTPDWTRYFMAFEATKDYSANRMSIGFHLGSIAQNFDIAGFTMLNYKDNYDLFDLPSSFENGFYGGSSPDADWREPAAARIEELRKSDLSVRVVNENGDGIEGVEINVEMEEHLFGFGSAFVTCRFPGNNCFDATYVEKVGNLDGKGHGFNVGVTENAVKWDGWEEEWIGTPTQTVNAIEYLHNNGVTMRGHTLIWPGFNNLPEDIQQNQNDLAYIRQRIEERIQTMINHPVLKDIIREWDVLNEITVNRDLEFAFKDDPNFETGRELYQEIFERIRELDPELKLYMNEYVVLSGGGSGTNVINRYKTFLTEINESSQPMDGIGFQCHIGSNPTSIYKLQEVFDEFYATYNVPIKITEYDVNELVNDEDAGKYLNDFLTMVFSHEAVNAFIMWGFWDGNHWKDNAPMFAEDWTLKPAGQVFIDKVFNEWWTNETVQSDDDGFATIRAFKGVHKITATKDGQTRVAQVSLDQDGSVQLVLEGVSNTNDVSDADFILSPNPATNGYFMISFPEELGTVDISVLSMDGRRVGIMNNIKPNVKTDLDLPTGMYLMNITSKSGTLTKKVIVE